MTSRPSSPLTDWNPSHGLRCSSLSKHDLKFMLLDNVPSVSFANARSCTEHAIGLVTQ